MMVSQSVPCATRSSTSATRIRVPLKVNFPWQTLGSATTYLATTFFFIDHPSPRVFAKSSRLASVVHPLFIAKSPFSTSIGRFLHPPVPERIALRHLHHDAGEFAIILDNGL